jgi:sugar-specific transcriptional regulator TrmB
MSDQTDNLVSLLIPYGLNADEARVYLDLWVNGNDSALGISRRVHLARTKVYRILDKLVSLGLTTMKLGSRGQRFEASNPQKFSFLAESKSREAQSLITSLPTIEEQLSRVGRQDNKSSKVLYYEGIEGLKQVTYNSLKAKGELLTMEITDMNAFFDQDFAESMRLKFIDKKITSRTLTNVTKIAPWTKVGGEMVDKYWEIRHIPAKQLKIKFEILIYNDVYVMYRYQGREIFCVEIYNQELTDMQRQIFEYMWAKARKFKVLNRQGEAVLK